LFAEKQRDAMLLLERLQEQGMIITEIIWVIRLQEQGKIITVTEIIWVIIWVIRLQKQYIVIWD
jgi:hypothetical protein